MTRSVPAGQVATIATAWTAGCAGGGPVTVGSANGWDTNLEDLRVAG